MRYRRFARIVSLLPLALFVGALLTSTRDPFFARPPDILGIPLGLLVAAFAMGWMLIGTGLAWDGRPRKVALAVVVFTIPAMGILILGPAVILILQNLG